MIIQAGVGQRRWQMTECNRGDAALGLRGFAGIGDNERIDHRQRAGDDFREAVRTEGNGLAGQPLQRAVRADMDDRMDPK